jgi:hypothetical protein
MEMPPCRSGRLADEGHRLVALLPPFQRMITVRSAVSNHDTEQRAHAERSSPCVEHFDIDAELLDCPRREFD